MLSLLNKKLTPCATFFDSPWRKLPLLLLAPMEGVGDRTFRKAMAAIGGFDWACTEFLRVPMKAHIPSLIRDYTPYDTAPIPQAIQLMGSDPALMAEVAKAVESMGAPRIDLNCGCPSNTVTGRGAGSSLLKTPDLLHAIAKAMVKAVSVPVTLKLRSGFTDTSLFRENLLAAQEAGVTFVTVHPRTKEDGYGPPANWDLIREAKLLLRIPVMGNGDIVQPLDALRMVEHTQCDGVMVGRGAVANPWIFWEIRALFAGQPYKKSPQWIENHLRTFIGYFPQEMPLKNRICKLKQVLSFILRPNPMAKSAVLTRSYESEEAVIQWLSELKIDLCDVSASPIQ
jgi:tRNA-dihydrouridine synthase C